MKTKKQNQSLGIGIILLVSVLLLGEINAIAQATNAASVMLSTNLPLPAGFATRLDYLKSFTNEADTMRAYRSGLISKNEAMMTHLLIGNMKEQRFYGKVVDQYGQPVAGANVIGYLRSDEGFGVNDEKVEELKTQTDLGGLFQFTGLHGARFGQKVSKDGYEMDSAGYIKQAGTNTSSGDRAVFIMWKLRGAQPMIHNEFQSRVPYDGTPAIFNLATGKKDPAGDLKITLTRSPLKIHKGWDKYDWTAKIESVNSGLITENDPYPNWAPENGYQPFFETSMSSNSVPWSAELRRDFYFRNAQKQYGRLLIDLSTDSTRPDTGITVQTWMNPSGSQNLEFDPKNQIR